MPTPYYYGTPRTALASITTSNTTWDGSGTLVTVMTGATAPGSMIVGVKICAIDTTTDGNWIKFFVGTRRVAQVSVTAATVAGTVAPFVTTWVPDLPIPVTSGAAFCASAHKNEPFHLVASLGDL